MLIALAHQVFSASEVRHVISGHVIDPHRVRPEGAVLLVRGQDEGSISSIPVSIEEDGSFVTPQLSSGTYVLEVVRTLFASAEPGGVIGFKIVRVGETDLSGVSIEVRRDTAIAGRLLMESDNPQARWPTEVVVNAFLALDGMPLWHSVVADAAPGGKFVLRNAFGPRVVRCGYFLAQGNAWWLSKVILNGVDITNVPTDFSMHGGGQLEVAFTQTPARIVGTVTDAKGWPVRAAWIVVNGAQRGLWQHWATPSDVTRGDAQGRFSLPVIPGTYRIHAVSHTAFDSVKAARKAVLQFAFDGVLVSLQEHEVKRVILTVREP